MSDEPEASVLGSLPRSRPQRRSDKRGARAEQTTATKKAPRPTPEPESEPAANSTREPESEPAANSTQEPDPPPRRACAAAALGDGAELVGTVVKASAELAEIGLTIGARALRTALSRLPLP